MKKSEYIVYSCYFPVNYILFLFIIIIYSLEIFTSANTDGLSLEFEWQQVSSSLQDSSQYFFRSQQYCSFDGFHSSSNFQVLQSL